MPAKQITLDDLYTGQQALAYSLENFSKGQQALADSFEDLSKSQQSLVTRVAKLEIGQQSLVSTVAKLEIGQQVLTEVVSTGFDTMNDRFDRLEIRVEQLEGRVGRLELRLGGVEAAQQETNMRLASIEGNHQANEADIKEIYVMLAAVKRRHSKQLMTDAALNRRVQRVETFLRELSAKTGISFKI